MDASASYRDIEIEVRADVKMSQLSRTQIWSSTICLKSSNGFPCLNRLLLMVNKAQSNQPLLASLYHTPTRTPFSLPAEQLRVPAISHNFVLASPGACTALPPRPPIHSENSYPFKTALKSSLTPSSRKGHSFLCATPELCLSCSSCSITPCSGHLPGCKLFGGRDHA